MILQHKPKKRINAYAKGADKEREIVRDAKARGYLSFRSAGSHSPVDVCIISHADNEICFIQAKAGKFSENAKEKLQKELAWLNGVFKVYFKVL